MHSPVHLVTGNQSDLLSKVIWATVWIVDVLIVIPPEIGVRVAGGGGAWEKKNIEKTNSIFSREYVLDTTIRGQPHPTVENIPLVIH
jgi:hypothetical protein